VAVALARAWVYGGDADRAVEFAREAVTTAEAAGDATLLADALDAQLLVHWGPDQLTERLAITGRLEDTVVHLTDVEARMTAHLWRLTTALETLDRQSPILGRRATATGQAQFLQRHGDMGEDEFDARAGTIPQRLLMMNGDLVREKTKEDLANAATRIGWLAPSDRAAVEVAYLTVLTRRPSPEEADHFAARLGGTRSKERGRHMTDLFWTLINSTEFSWDH
jgi:hypothetical protein